tara:strand:- start:308 stop:604 length:297 start_codon:yes stop_codon:yes gene_type:complete
MIDQLLMSRDGINYAIAISAIILSTVTGYFFGHQSPQQICAEYIVEAERLTETASDCNQKLTACESRGAGECVLDCTPVCANQVADALLTHKNIVCED